MRVKTCPVRIKAAGTNEGVAEGQFEALVATYDKDSVGDVIVPGAFAETLLEWKASGDAIPIYWSHRLDDPDYNIGWVLEAEEREGQGLWVRGQLDLDGAKATQVYKLLKGRRVTQFSFTYDIGEGAFVETDEGYYYELRKLRLYETGPTPIGANQATELLDVKAADGRVVQLAVSGARPSEVADMRKAVEAQLDAIRVGNPHTSEPGAADGDDTGAPTTGEPGEGAETDEDPASTEDQTRPVTGTVTEPETVPDAVTATVPDPVTGTVTEPVPETDAIKSSDAVTLTLTPEAATNLRVVLEALAAGHTPGTDDGSKSATTGESAATHPPDGAPGGTPARLGPASLRQYAEADLDLVDL